MKWLGRIGTPLALLIGAAAGIVIGWGLGSWTTCAAGPGCDLRLDAVNTVVGLVGGIGTFVALLIGLIAFSQENSAKARATVLDSRRSAVRFKPVGYDQGNGRYSKIHIEVTNQTAKDMMNVSFVLDRGKESERILRKEHQVHSGQTFGTSVSAAEVELAPLHGDENKVREIINSQLRNRVSFFFDIDGEGFVREGGDVQLQCASE